MVRWFTLLPRSKNVLGLDLLADWSFSLFACFPSAFFLGALASSHSLKISWLLSSYRYYCYNYRFAHHPSQYLCSVSSDIKIG